MICQEAISAKCTFFIGFMLSECGFQYSVCNNIKIVDKPVTISSISCHKLCSSSGPKGEYWADLSTSMKFGKYLDQN